jgi:hypothetical protein
MNTIEPNPRLQSRSRTGLATVLTAALVAACGGEPPSSDDAPPTTSTCSPGSPTRLDRDGDGLADRAETEGWTLTVIDRFGEAASYPVTSDPDRADSDGDGLCDGEERSLDADPTAHDTDGDGLSDFEEARRWGTAPYSVDTDTDGLSDRRETEIGTSPILADSDGDGRSDGVEVDELTQPLLADLPRPALEFVGTMNVTLNMRLESGEIAESDVSATLQQGRSTRFSRSNVVASGSSVTNSRSISTSAEASYPWGAKVKVEGSLSRTENSFNETTTSWSRESVRSTQQAYSEALSRTRSRRQSIDSGTIAFQLMIRNEGRRTFRISDVVVTALRKSSDDPADFTSIATLSMPDAATDLVLGEGESAGPFRVEAEIPANVARDLLANPSGIFVRVASRRLFDVHSTDFAFSVGEDTYNRTASIVIDYGDARPPEAYRVATNARRTPEGRSAGVRLGHALEHVIGLEPGTDYQTAQRDGTSVLTSIRGVGAADQADGPARFWVVMASENQGPGVPGSVDQRILADDLDFDDIVLFERDKVYLAYVQDGDGDGLFAREEYLHGTFDHEDEIAADAPSGATSVDSDGDGLSDYEEIRGGWLVEAPVEPYTTAPRVFSDPTAADLDDDGWDDVRERNQGTDPKSADTDGDGLLDPEDDRPLVPRLTEPPRILSVMPSPSALDVPLTARIEARFDQPMSPTSMIHVHGDLRGAIAGTVQRSADGRSLVFIPDEPFLAGERVEISLGADATNADGVPMDRGFVSTFRVLVASTSGSFFPMPDTENPDGHNLRQLVRGDFDRDGDIDLAGRIRNGIDIYANTDGTFAVQSSLTEAYGLQQIATGDLDGDGYLDLVAVFSDDADGIYVFRNRADGTGAFGPAVSYRVDGAGSRPNPLGLALGDVDGDGDLDVVTANGDAEDVSILPNNGDARFGSVQRVSVRFGDGPNQDAYAPVLLDAEGDGDLDLAVGQHGARQLALLENEGGRFTPVQSWGIAGSALSTGFADDFDGDGAPDVVLAQDREGVSLSRNDGEGRFDRSVDLWTPGYARDVAAGDLDGDGDVDLVAACGRAELAILQNAGDATFPGAPLLAVSDGLGFQHVAALDVDGDGDLDLVASRYGRLVVFTNE